MMMGPVGIDAAMPRGGPDQADGPGKKMQAVGQKAKMAVAMAREAGIDLPKNAQGIAASGLARGADPESLFASLVEPDPVDPDPVGDPDMPVTDEPVAPVDDATLLAKAMAVPVQDMPPEIGE